MRAKAGVPMRPAAISARTSRSAFCQRKFSCTISGRPAASAASTIASPSA